MAEAPVEVSVPEVRDYTRINAEVVRLLDAGHRQIKLAGVDGQRLLLHAIRGDWTARIDVDGDAGPELAAELDAPGVRVVCSGSAADGAGRGLRFGAVLILGDAGEAVGCAQVGGLVVVAGSAGARAGLGQSGGVLVVGGSVGRLAGERRTGGRMAVPSGAMGHGFGRGSRLPIAVGPDAREAVQHAADAFGPLLPSALLAAVGLG